MTEESYTPYHSKQLVMHTDQRKWVMKDVHDSKKLTMSYIVQLLFRSLLMEPVDQPSNNIVTILPALSDTTRG